MRMLLQVRDRSKEGDGAVRKDAPYHFSQRRSGCWVTSIVGHTQEDHVMWLPYVQIRLWRLMIWIVFVALLLQSLLTGYRWCFYPRFARAFASMAEGAKASSEGHERNAFHNQAVADRKAAGQEWESAAQTAEYDRKCVVLNRELVLYYMKLSERYQAASTRPWRPFGPKPARPKL
jgi:hypothetical protein